LIQFRYASTSDLIPMMAGTLCAMIHGTLYVASNIILGWQVQWTHSPEIFLHIISLLTLYIEHVAFLDRHIRWVRKGKPLLKLFQRFAGWCWRRCRRCVAR
jgi:hypothetical protein